jgi:hypothetical protein
VPADRPGGEPAGPPRALATDAGRERLISVLREHYAHGLLDDAELRRRVGIVLAARFTDEAAEAIAGLPALAGPDGDQDQRNAGEAAGRPRRRRYAESPRPGPGWVPTQERFRDPASGKIMRVWVDPTDQARHYVPEPEGR